MWAMICRESWMWTQNKTHLMWRMDVIGGGGFVSHDLWTILEVDTMSTTIDVTHVRHRGVVFCAP